MTPITPPTDESVGRTAKVVELFVPVIQRRLLRIDPRLLALIEPLFLIETHLSFEERLLLLETALELPNDFLVCEIGSYLGASTAFLAAAAVLKGGHVHCVDTWDNVAMGLEPSQDTYATFLGNIFRFRPFITPHRGRASERAKDIGGGFDLLFVDGDHSYESVRSDLSHYVPKLKKQGLLALHDFDYESVSRAVTDHFSGQLPASKGRVHSLQVFQLAT
jgi:predicted O-methyltransferase YrrM